MQLTRTALQAALAFALSIGAPTFARAEDNPYAALASIDRIILVNAFYSTDHPEKSISLSEKSLRNFLLLKFRNNFSQIKIDIGGEYEGVNDGRFYCKVMLVGENYPVAYHVKCALGDPFSEIWEKEFIGIGGSKLVPDSIKKLIEQMTEDAAVELYKAKGILTAGAGSKKGGGGRAEGGEALKRDVSIDVMEAQVLLTRLGYQVGAPDGLMGEKTKTAIRVFQKKAGSIVDGEISERLLEQLRFMTAGSDKKQ